MNTNPYSQAIIRRIKAAAKKQVKDCRAIPWQDAEKQVRKQEYSSSETVHENVKHIQVGDWCAIAYIQTRTSGQTYVIDLPELP